MKDLSWYGWANTNSGYGIVNLEYATALNKLVDVSIGWERREHILADQYALFTDEQKALWEKPFKRSRVGIIKTTPQLFSYNKSDFKIGYTMVENTKIGKGWVEYCNQMDAIFVPTPFLIDVFRDCGVKQPIRSVKQGVNSKRFPYFERTVREKYVFGTIGYIDDRKNWEALVRAFCSEFDPSENVELWIKNSNRYFSHKAFKDKRIKVINKPFTFYQVSRFYQLLDCFVFPSHAEGSGLPPREAMATGLPTILTNWSGLSEICNVNYNFPLEPVSIDHPDIRGEEQPGFMANISIEDLMSKMRYCFQNRQKALEIGKRGSEYIHKEWNWDVCASDLLLKVKEVAGDE